MLRGASKLYSLVALCLATTGCSLAPVISQGSIDYNRTVEDVTSNILVVNILRARDGAPLFFSDISQIRGSIATNFASQVGFPFGPANRPPTGTGVRAAAQETLTITSAPTFDIAPSNTKQFYQGILQPINKNILAYYINRGIDSNILFNLLVSHIDVIRVSGGTETLIKSIEWSSSSEQEYTASPQFTDLIDEWSKGDRKPRVAVFSGLTNFGPPVAASARAIVEAKTADLDAKGLSGGLVQFRKKSSQVHICVPNRAGAYLELEVIANRVDKAPEPDSTPKSNSACSKSIKEAAGDENASGEFIYYRARTRSVESIFYYLGYLVRTGAKPPIPFAIGSGDSKDARFAVAYRGDLYSVNQFGTLNQFGVKDGTLIILSILNDLLNINRDANEIPTTKAVQAVGASG